MARIIRTSFGIDVFLPECVSDWEFRKHMRFSDEGDAE
jgi:hypothetical protein